MQMRFNLYDSSVLHYAQFKSIIGAHHPVYIIYAVGKWDTSTATEHKFSILRISRCFTDFDFDGSQFSYCLWKLEDVKENESYKKAKEILEKFDPSATLPPPAPMHTPSPGPTPGISI